MAKKKDENEIKEALKQIKKKKDNKKEVEELTDSLQRLQAEFENYEKRCQKDSIQIRQYAAAHTINKLLPIVDSFELALKNKDNSEEFTKGIELIFKQLLTTLEQEGLRKIDCEGKKVDPYMHDVMLTEKSDKEENTVLQELQRGYMFKDKVLRHSKVKVAKK